MERYFKIEYYDLVLLFAGIIALFAAIVPVIFRNKYFSAPIFYLIIGIAGYFIILHYQIDPLKHLEVLKRLTEFVVLVALANAGLRINEPFKWKTWRHASRLLIITMPITIIAATFLGWWVMGFAPATAMLYGALISPTDPVLAGELQTSAPGEKDNSVSKLGLTAEAGINDGLAFPFTYFAIHASLKGLNYKEWIGDWFLHDFLIKIILGIGIGLLTGWLLFKIVFSTGSKDDTLGRISRGILSLALILLPYAIAEIVGGYGFLAVFFAASVFSRYEKHKKHMNSLHDFNEELESFVVAILFIIIGIFIGMHYRMIIEPKIIAIALLMVLVVRPVVGYLSLIKTNLNAFQKFVLSFYGIRGIGSLYYLAYGLTAIGFEKPKTLVATTTATIFYSVLIHGITARWVQKNIKRYDQIE
ncbi:cation:proton antiporter [Flavobacterium rhizosphaerae]|uniref:Cation:proton antiporter n=1 Tax=Flavobacterium rhizosphaerae TaxID=3163298 RepID=A0ABW8YVR2_9FLAO